MARESNCVVNRFTRPAANQGRESRGGVWRRSLVVALLLGCATGCQTLRDKTDTLKNSSKDMLSWQRKEGEKTADDPTRMVVIWTSSSEPVCSFR